MPAPTGTHTTRIEPHFYSSQSTLTPRRSAESVCTSYVFGFNGKENDNEVKGTGNQQDYGMRIYDPRLGRFLSADPLIVNQGKYPWWSPYHFAGNTPIWAIDLDGLETWYTQNGDMQEPEMPFKEITGPISEATQEEYGLISGDTRISEVGKNMTVAIIPGSKPKSEYADVQGNFHSTGGMMGGHTYMIVGNTAFGFTNNTDEPGPVLNSSGDHFFPSTKNSNSKFEKMDAATVFMNAKEFQQRLIAFKIDATLDQYYSVLGAYESNVSSPSYDYAIFGKRCASSNYGILQDAGILPKDSWFLERLSNDFTPAKYIDHLQSLGFSSKVMNKGFEGRTWAR